MSRSVHLYDRNLTSPVYVQNLSEHIESLSYSTKLHGGFSSCSFAYPCDLLTAYDWYLNRHFYRLVVEHEGAVRWEGRIEDIAITLEGLKITALGYWANAFDAPRNYIFADDRFDNWLIEHSNQGWDKFRYQKGDRLFLTTDQKRIYRVGDIAEFRYTYPFTGDWELVKVSYSITLPSANFAVRLIAAVDGQLAGGAGPTYGTGTYSQAVSSRAYVGVTLECLVGGPADRIEAEAVVPTNWSQISNGIYEGCSGNSIIQSNINGATKSLTFYGTSIKVFALKGNNYGIPRWRIDGGGWTNWDGYGANQERNCIMLELNNLSATTSHTLDIEVTASKNASSSDYFVVLDYFEVDPPSAWFNSVLATDRALTGGTTLDVDDIVTGLLTGCGELVVEAANINLSATQGTVNVAYYDEDKPPGETIPTLSLRADTTVPYYLAVWDDRKAYWRARGSGKVWEIMLADLAPNGLSLERSAVELWNAVYGIYRDGEGLTQRTATATDTGSTGKYGLTRTKGLPVNGSNSTVAASARDLYLLEQAELRQKSRLVLDKYVYDRQGNRHFLDEVRADDTIRIRDLIPVDTAARDTIDRLRTFLVMETSYDADRNVLTVTPDWPADQLELMLANAGKKGT